MEKQWYYVDEHGEQAGPISQNEIVSRLEAQKLDADTMIWSKGQTSWKKANSVFPEFASEGSPPPLPEQSGKQPAGASSQGRRARASRRSLGGGNPAVGTRWSRIQILGGGVVVLGLLIAGSVLWSPEKATSALGSLQTALAESGATLWPFGNAETAMFRGGPARTGVYEGSGPKEKPVVKWRFETGGNVESSPAVANGVVYIGSIDRSFLHALQSKSRDDGAADGGRTRSAFEGSSTGRAPSERVMRAAIVSSLEENVPRSIHRRIHTRCVNGNVSDLGIRDVGQVQQTDEKTYWPVKVRVTGSCEEAPPACGNYMFGACETLDFDKSRAEFRVWQDPYGDWQASMIRR